MDQRPNRVHCNVRLPPKLRAELTRRAALNDRTFSGEVEHRLNTSLRDDAMEARIEQAVARGLAPMATAQPSVIPNMSDADRRDWLDS